MSRLAVVALALLAVAAASAQQDKPWETWQPLAVTLPTPNAFDIYLKAFALKQEIDDTWWPTDAPPGAPGAPPAAGGPGGPPAPPPPPPAPGAPPPPGPGDRPPPRPHPPTTYDGWVEGNPDLPLPERLAMYGDVLALVRTALPLECGIAPPEGPDALMPYLRGFRQVARLFAMEAEMRRQDGRFGDAAASALDCFEVAQDAKTQQTLVGYLVGVACDSVALSSLDETLSGLKADEAKAALARLQVVSTERRSLAQALDGEEACERNFLKRMPTDAHELRMKMGFTLEVTDAQLAALVADRARLWQELGLLSDAARRNLALPYRQRVPGPQRRDFLLIEFFARSYDAILFRDTVAQTRLNLRLLALAAQAYRAEHGNFPPHLMDLVPDNIADIPQDPFTGGPLSAVIAADDVVLYSFGPDGLDNGGLPADKQLTPDSKGDIVLELNLTPQP